MENLIDKSFFWGELKITGLNAYESEQEDELNMFIAKFQKDYLTRMFGSSTILPKDLLYYLVDDDLKISPIANFVFCNWLKRESVFQTNSGAKVLNIQNTEKANVTALFSSAWNEMARKNNSIQNEMLLQGPITMIIDDVEVFYDYKTDLLPKIDRLDSIFTFSWL